MRRECWSAAEWPAGVLGGTRVVLSAAQVPCDRQGRLPVDLSRSFSSLTGADRWSAAGLCRLSVGPSRQSRRGCPFSLSWSPKERPVHLTQLRGRGQPPPGRLPLLSLSRAAVAPRIFRFVSRHPSPCSCRQRRGSQALSTHVAMRTGREKKSRSARQQARS